MEFPSVPAGPFAVLFFGPFTVAVHLETGAIDQQMQRFAAFNRFRQKCQAIPTTAEYRVIRNSDIHVEELPDRSERSLDLAQSEAEHQPQRQSGLDRQIGINRLTTAFSGGRRTPSGDCLLGQPNCQASPSHQSRVILWPVRHLVLRRRYLACDGGLCGICRAWTFTDTRVERSSPVLTEPLSFQPPRPPSAACTNTQLTGT